MKTSAMLLAAAAIAAPCAFAQTPGGTASGPSTAGIGSPSSAASAPASSAGIPAASAGGIPAASSAGVPSPSSGGIPSPSAVGTGTAAAPGTTADSPLPPARGTRTGGGGVPGSGGVVAVPGGDTTVLPNGTITGGAPIRGDVPVAVPAPDVSGPTVLRNDGAPSAVRPRTAPVTPAVPDDAPTVQAPALPAPVELQPSALRVSSPSDELPTADAGPALDREAAGATELTTTATAGFPEGSFRPAATYSTEETASEGREVRPRRTIEK